MPDVGQGPFGRHTKEVTVCQLLGGAAQDPFDAATRQVRKTVRVQECESVLEGMLVAEAGGERCERSGLEVKEG